MSRTVSDSSAADVVPVGGLVPLSKEGAAYIESGDHVYLKTGAMVDGTSLPFAPPSGVPSISSIFGLVSFPVAGTWRGIAKAPAGVYVAVSSGGTICHSNDGLAWERASLPSDTFSGVAYGLGRFIVFSPNAIYGSTDGVNWSRQSRSLSNPSGITFAQDKFVIVGSSCSYVSTNGTSWVEMTHSISSMGAVAGNSNCFIGALESNSSKAIARSNDGYNWGATSLPLGYFAKIVFGNGVFVAIPYSNASSQNIWFSIDGITWKMSSASNAGMFTDIAFGGNQFVAIGFSNASPTTSTPYYSSDGINWTYSSNLSHPSFVYPVRIAFISGDGGNSQFYATAPGYSFITTNGGVSWSANAASAGSVWASGLTNLTARSSNDIAGASGTSVYYVTSAASSQPNQYNISSLNGTNASVVGLYGSSTRSFYVDGGGRKCGYTTGPISSDGWTGVNAVFSDTASCAATDDEGLVVVLHNGSACAWVSTDAGKNYEAAAIPIWAEWTDVVFGGTTCVAVAKNTDRCAVSTDGGATWTLGTMPSSAVWTGITYGNGQFVAVAGGTKAATSSDGVTWVARTLPSSSDWISVAFGQNMFVAVSNTSGTTAASSPDGVTWTARTLPASGTWRKVIYGERFMAVASSSTNVALSTNGTSWTAGGALPAASVWVWLVYSKQLNIYAIGATSSSNYVTSNTAGSSWSLQGSSIGAVHVGDAVGIFGEVHIFLGSIYTSPYARVVSLAGGAPYFAGNQYAGPSGQTPAIAVSGNTIVACIGNKNTTPSSTYRSYLITSVDNGLTWRLTYNPRSAMSWVVRGSTHFFAYANPGGVIVRSTDGVTWEEMTPPVAASHLGLFKDDAEAIYVVCTNTDKLMKTTDGLSWQTIKLPTISSWQVGAYGNGKYAVLSNSGFAAISSDGVNWTMATIPVEADRWYAMSYTDKFIALCGGTKRFGITSGDLATTQTTYGAQTAVAQTSPFAADLYLRIK